jgi:hypothetical protein|eukprot:SAG25_NODE_44_length_19254_cov_246.998121_19_plen_56_part_00
MEIAFLTRWRGRLTSMAMGWGTRWMRTQTTTVRPQGIAHALLGRSGCRLLGTATQ